MSDLILYTTDNGRSEIRLSTEKQTVGLTQLEMGELFDATKQNISLHLKDIFEDRERAPATTVKACLTVQTEGPPQVQRPVALFNLDAILAVGFRVRSPRGSQFRRWASTVLTHFLRRGFAMDDERLKTPTVARSTSMRSWSACRTFVLRESAFISKSATCSHLLRIATRQTRSTDSWSSSWKPPNCLQRIVQPSR